MAQPSQCSGSLVCTGVLYEESLSGKEPLAGRLSCLGGA